MESIPSSAIEEILRSHSLEMHTMLPGTVTFFDKEKQTVNVQIDIKRKYDQEVEAISELKEVPIIYPRAGGYLFTLPVAEGDQCMLIFAERSLDNWVKSGGIVDPADSRHHDLSDAVAYVGMWSENKSVTNYNAVEPEFRTEDGVKKVWMNNEGWVEMVNQDLDTRVVLKEDGEVRVANDKVKGVFDISNQGRLRSHNPNVSTTHSVNGTKVAKNLLTQHKQSKSGDFTKKTLLGLSELKKTGEKKFKNMLLKEVKSAAGSLSIKTGLGRLSINPAGIAKLGNPNNKLDINAVKSSLGGPAARVLALPALGKTLLQDASGTVTPQLVLSLASVVLSMASSLGLNSLVGSIGTELSAIETLVEGLIEDPDDFVPETIVAAITNTLIERNIDPTTTEGQAVLLLARRADQNMNEENLEILADAVTSLIEGEIGG